jgi:four helix bundle protein
MTFEEWLASVPVEITDDALWRMEVYRLALFASDLAWHDVSRLVQDKRTISLSDQLYEAVGSISANIAEGYSRSSGKDEARFYEYSLGSAREARTWYFQGRHVLGATVTLHRIRLLTQIIRLLRTIMPAERRRKLAEERVTYGINIADLLDNPPMP